ncbi:MAG: SGNH/GDSL hydrolase family protein [Luteolibacter sp.]|uniref:SGNH/GDSL hydrolase family protein n=1 Tax=Luteolibacter sp. TaxID=1962973 RepID=UPI00326333D0
MKSFARLLVKLSCILGLASCATQPPLPPGPAGDHPEKELAERVAASPRLAVLFVGNSYSFGVPKAFSKLAAEHGKNVRVGHSTFGGWTLTRHAAYEPTLQKIRDGKWDVVVIQEHSEIPAQSPRKRAGLMFPPLRKLVILARDAGAVPVLYQTWGRRDGEKNVRHDDFYKMTERLREGYRAAAKNAGGLVVVPVGDAWEQEFSAGNGARLFIEDGSHPSAFGNDVTAEVFYQTLWLK